MSQQIEQKKNSLTAAAESIARSYNSHDLEGAKIPTKAAQAVLSSYNSHDVNGATIADLKLPKDRK